MLTAPPVGVRVTVALAVQGAGLDSMGPQGWTTEGGAGPSVDGTVGGATGGEPAPGTAGAGLPPVDGIVGGALGCAS